MIGKNLASWCKLFWKYSERQVTWSPSCQRILGVCGTKAIRPRKSQIHGCKSISLQIFANGNPKVAVLLLLLRLWTPRPPPFWGVLIWLGFLLKHASFVVGNLAHVMQTCSIVQHRATSCNIVQHRATSCNIVQHRATSCNIVQQKHIKIWLPGLAVRPSMFRKKTSEPACKEQRKNRLKMEILYILLW